MASHRIRWVIIAVACALVATACGGQDGPERTAPSGDPGFPVTVETAFGEVTIPDRPRRVVALGWGDAATALALGVQPVGASDWLDFGGSGVGPWADDLYDRPPEIIDTLEPNLEQIAALEPDLILDVNSSGDPQRHASLSKIAPVVGVPEGGQDYATTWRQQMTLISTAVGRPDRGRELIRRLDQLFTRKAKQFPQFAGKTIVIAARTAEGWGAYTDTDVRTRFARSLGFATSPAIRKRASDGFSVDVSEERLDLLDADLTVVIPIGVKPTRITDDPLFRRIPSVAEGRYVMFGDQDVRKAFSAGTTLALRFALRKVPPVFAQALDGAHPDPRGRASGTDHTVP